MDRVHLIVGNSRDYHAVAIKWALRRMGHDALIWDGISTDPSGQLTIGIHGAEWLRMGERELGRFQSVWFRRQIPFEVAEDVHPDARGFLMQELTDAHLSLCASVEAMSDFVIGGQRTKHVSSKAYQLQIAERLGFNIPRTLISSHYRDVVSFAKTTNKLLVKHFAPHYFISKSSGAVKAVGPSVVCADDLSQEKIEICPCIYQEYIDKKYELRVTVIGNRLYAAKLSSNVGDLLDWRPAYGSDRLEVEPFELDDETTRRIHLLMERLGLHYGCIDFAVDQSDNLIFFEINPGGQFLFIEEKIKNFKLLHAFALMLATQSTEFSMCGGRHPIINMGEFEASPEFDNWKIAYDTNASKNPKFVTFVE